ncbi:MAG: LamG domain-containing protein [Phycisphaerae bacterium]
MKTTTSVVGLCALASLAAARPALPAEPMGKSRLPQNGLVGYWAGEGNASDSAGANHGRIIGGVTFVKGKVGDCFKLDGKGAHIHIGNPPALRITGDQTVAMWLRADTIQKHMNPFHKAYGGEFSVLLRLGGRLRYAFGMAGGNGRPYAALIADDAVQALKDSQWVHFAAVRDIKAKKVRLYVNGRKAAKVDGWMLLPGEANGRPYRGDITSLPRAVASSYPAYIGKGNNDCFAGLIDELAIWNRALSDAEVALVAGAWPELPHLTRPAGADRILTASGDVLLGDIANAQFSITTSFGKVTVPAGRVIGLAVAARSGAARAAQDAAPCMVLTDGQVLVGKLLDPAVKIRLASGSTLTVPPDKIREFAYRVSEGKPSAARPAGTMVSLADGGRLALAGAGPELQLLTAHGKVDLPAAGVRSIEATGKAERPHVVRWANGSVLSGTLLPEKLALKLRLGAQTTVGRDSVRRIDRAIEPVGPAGAATVELKNGDRLFGTVTDNKLTLGTSLGDTAIRPANLRAMAFDPAKPGELEVTMWDGAVLRGRLAEAAVTFAIVPGGPTVKVKTAEIVAIARSSADPPEEIVRKVLTLISRLGAESYKDRQAATKALLAMGPGIVPLLLRHRKDPDPEIRQRIEGILESLEGKAPGRAGPPPPRPPPQRTTRDRQLMERS